MDGRRTAQQTLSRLQLSLCSYAAHDRAASCILSQELRRKVLSTWGTTCRVDSMQQACHQIVAAAAIVSRFCTNSLGHVPQGGAVHAGMVACGRIQTIDGTVSCHSASFAGGTGGTPAAGMTTPCAMRYRLRHSEMPMKKTAGTLSRTNIAASFASCSPCPVL